jgi:outer membrane protein assembly factor BamB
VKESVLRENVQSLAKRAWGHLGEKDYGAAHREFLRWTELAPSSAIAWFGVAWCEVMRALPGGNPRPGDDWEPKMVRALQLHGGQDALSSMQQLQAHALLGAMHGQRGEDRAAADHYEKAIELDANPVTAARLRLALAGFRAALGELDIAERLVLEALVADPGLTPAADVLTMVRHQRESFDIVFDVPLHRRTIVRVHPDDSFGAIASRVFSDEGIPVPPGSFIYSGDETLPGHASTEMWESEQTIREAGVKPRDTVLYVAVIEWKHQKSGRLVSDITAYRRRGFEALVRHELHLAMKSIDIHIDLRELDEAKALVDAILGIAPGEPRATVQRARIEHGIARRNAGSAAAERSGWCQSHGVPTRTGQALDALEPPLRELWGFRAATEITSPVTAHGNVYVGSWDGSIYCHDALSGAERWCWRGARPLREPAAIAGGNLVVVDDAAISCVNALSGDVRWRQPAARSSCSVIVDEVVITGTTDGHVRCTELASGRPVGEVATGGEALHGLAALGTQVFAVGTSSVLALDRSSGKVIWRRPGRFDGVMPVCANDRVYVGSFSEGLWCLDAHSGRRLWIFCTEAPIKAAPAAARECVIFGDTGGRFGCIDAITGELLWTPREWVANRVACSAAPIIAGQRVYVRLDDGVLYCLDFKSGRELSRVTAEAWIQGIGSLAATSGAIYFSAEGGYLGCLARQELTAAGKTVDPRSLPPRGHLPRPDPDTIEIRAGHFVEKSTLSEQEHSRFLLAASHMMLGRYDEVIAILRPLAETHPREEVVLHNLCYAYLRNGQVGDALSILDRILEINPCDIQTFSLLASVLRKHRDIVHKIYGDGSNRILTGSCPSPPAKPALVIALDGRDPVVLWRSSGAIGSNVRSAPTWYWWQLFLMASYPVLRLYMEIDHQPERWYDLALPMDVADAATQEWLSRLLTKDLLQLHVYDASGRHVTCKAMAFDAGQKSRLSGLLDVAGRTLAAIDHDRRDFNAAVNDCEKDNGHIQQIE